MKNLLDSLNNKLGMAIKKMSDLEDKINETQKKEKKSEQSIDRA